MYKQNNKNEIDKLLYKYLNDYNNIDSVILGCTHYPIIKKKIKSIS